MASEAAMPRRLSTSSTNASLSVYDHNMVERSIFMRSDYVFQWIQQYSLDELVGNTGSDERMTDECMTSDWIESILHPTRGRSVFVKAKTAMPELQSFAPFNLSTTVTPDVSVEFPYHDKTLTVLTIEVLSGASYRQTVSKAVVNGIEQLRVIRMVCPTVSECVSYVFPKSNTRHGVTRLNIQFIDLHFRITCSHLEQSDVRSDITRQLAIVCGNIAACSYRAHEVYPYYVRLSQTECDLISQGSKQVYSKHNIIVRSSDQSKYFKYSLSCGKLYHLYQEMRVRSNQSLFLYSLLPTRRVGHLGLPFYEYPALRGPLTERECIRCLIPFIEGVKRALEELHEHDTAHLDLQLSNVCFEEDGTVVLIDLERCEDVKESESIELSLRYPGCDMYDDKGKLWQFPCYDWKCLGMIICKVLEPSISDRQYYSMVSENLIPSALRQDPFVNGLLEEGCWMEAHFRAFWDAHPECCHPIEDFIK